MEQYRQLSSSADLWGWLSVATLLFLGIVELAGFLIDEEKAKKKKQRVELVGLLVLVALGIVDCEQRHVENTRAALAERAFLDRQLPSDLTESIAILHVHTGDVDIHCTRISDREINRFCEQIARLFAAGGWHVMPTGAGITAGGPPIVGVQVEYSTGQDVVALDAVRGALRAADVPFDEQQDGLGQGIRLIIGEKPSL